MKTIKRREFVSNTAKMVAATSVFPLYSFANDSKPASAVKTRIAIAGTGNRGTYSWGLSIVNTYRETIEIVALCDINTKRMAASKKVLGVDAKTFEVKDFDLMIQETKPNIVLVTTTDCFHEKYIVRALELGCDVINVSALLIPKTEPVKRFMSGSMLGMVMKLLK
jgi:hypothetical protein